MVSWDDSLSTAIYAFAITAGTGVIGAIAVHFFSKVPTTIQQDS